MTEDWERNDAENVNVRPYCANALLAAALYELIVFDFDLSSNLIVESVYSNRKRMQTV